MNFELKEAGKSDFSLIAALAKEIWEKHYPDIIGMEQVQYMLNKFYSDAALLTQMESGQRFYLILDTTSNPLGFFSLSQDASNNAFLHKFYVLQATQAKGLGSMVFAEMVKRFSPHTIRLTVNRQNFKAINFYFKNGFIIEKVEDFDIGNGYQMNDFVMLWKK